MRHLLVYFVNLASEMRETSDRVFLSKTRINLYVINHQHLSIRLCRYMNPFAHACEH